MFTIVVKSYWDVDVLTAYLINTMSSSVLVFQTPFVVLIGSNVFHSVPTRVFGCICLDHDHGIGKTWS